uniref:Mediator of RNA polymerase II transcription subunit 22 n=1 Tax=Rhabditophanes sp. KR3021 TaxID=114890 RepID=A0AC35TYU0_9BILA
MQPSGSSNLTATSLTNKSHANKAMTIQEYKGRLKDLIKSINDNFAQILMAAKPTQFDESKDANRQKLAESATDTNEMAVRAATILKSTDGLFRLIQDMKEFLILRDFSFLSESVEKAQISNYVAVSNEVHLRDEAMLLLNGMIDDIDSEMRNNFGLTM